MSIYLKEFSGSGGRGSNNNLPFKERVIIFLLALFPLVVAIILHKIF